MNNPVSFLCFSVFCGSLLAISSTSPLFVGGLYETLGSTQNLHSFGEYFPTSNTWDNINAGVLSTGSSAAIALIDSPDEETSGIVVGGIFNYLNHTSNSISFGNIAFFREYTGQWETLGYGCNAAVDSLVVIPLISIEADSICTVQSPCYTIVVGGHFTECLQANEDKTAISYPDGLGFFDMTQKIWYTPVGQTLPQMVSISSLEVLNNILFLTGNSATSNETTGWAFGSQMLFDNEKNEISTLNWTKIASTTGSESNGRINSFVAHDASTFYIGGYFQMLQQANGVQIPVNNIAMVENGVVSSLAGGTDGEVISACLVTTTIPPILYIAGPFSEAGLQQQVNNIARWSTSWEPLDLGLQLSNYSTIGNIPDIQLSAWGSNVIVGGALDKAGSIAVQNIAMWDGAKWSPVGDSTPFEQYRMLPFEISSSGHLYVAAQGLQDFFLEDVVIVGYPLVENLMATCDLSIGHWSDLVYNELLIDGVVVDMAFHGSKNIILGGGFRKVGAIENLNNVVMMNDDGVSWDAFDGGLFGIITAIQVVGDDVYVGGILKYNGTNTGVMKYTANGYWEDLGLSQIGNDATPSARPKIFDLALSADSMFLYAGGNFYADLDGPVFELAAFDLTLRQWTAAAPSEIHGKVRTLLTVGDLLYVGGDYSFSVGNQTTYNFSILSFNGTGALGTWQPITPTCNPDLKECISQTILSIDVNPSIQPTDPDAASVYIGGEIENINGSVMNGMARLVDHLWVSFGEGVSGDKGVVFTLSLSPDYSTLYAAGDFSKANSIPVSDIVAWDVVTSTFSALSPIQGWSGVIFDLLPEPMSGDSSSDDVPPDDVNLVLIGFTIFLSFVVCCLLVIIIVISTVFLRSRPGERPHSQHSIQEKEQWEDYYSYEWEVSYNLLEISGTVGTGRNGTVHKAMYKGQQVAVKIFNADIAGIFYLREGICKYSSVLRSLQHPNILHVIGASADPLSLVTEYSELGSLSDIIRINPGKLTWSRVKSIALDTARGMSFLHGQEPSLLHQNLTSNNIIVNEYWAVKICDAGLSNILGESGEYKVSLPKRWSAPEVLLGRQYTTKSDVFSYGMMLYHLMSHIVPYSVEEKEMEVSVTQLIIRGVRPMVPPNREHVPAQLIDLMKQCWREKPEDRPEFRNILTQLNGIPDADLQRADKK